MASGSKGHSHRSSESHNHFAVRSRAPPSWKYIRVDHYHLRDWIVEDFLDGIFGYLGYYDYRIEVRPRMADPNEARLSDTYSEGR